MIGTSSNNPETIFTISSLPITPFLFASRLLNRHHTQHIVTRMHSNRMRTARSSSRPGGGGSPPGTSPQDQTPPRDQAPAGSRHSPSWDQTPPPPGPGTLLPGPDTPPYGQTHTCKHITLPQTSFAGGKNNALEHNRVFPK